MPRGNVPLYSLNGGEIDKNAAARIDLQRNQYAAQFMQNYMPTVIGKMQFRPGFEFLTTSDQPDERKRLIPFVGSVTESYILEFRANEMRVVFNNDYLSNEAVTTTIADGDFNAFTGWTDASTGGGAAAVAGNLRLNGSTAGEAIARQSVTVAAGDQGVEHTLVLNVTIGPATLRVGTSAGAADLLSVVAEEGSHVLTFNPGSNATIWVQLSNPNNTRVEVADIQFVAAAAPISVAHPWAYTDLASIRYFQSIDVIFIASDGFQQRRIERRGQRSWSIVRYKVANGPFDIQPETDITLNPSSTTGIVTITANQDYFTQADVGSLLRLQHAQQREQGSLQNAEDASDTLRIAGVGDSRRFTVNVSNFNGHTVVLERAFDEALNFAVFQTYTANQVNRIVDDNLDNQIVFYRLRLSVAGSGNINYNIFFQGGITQGVGRIIAFNNATTVTANVLDNFGAPTATGIWDRGTWSDRAGWPDTVTIFDGRLWWGRGDIVYGSVSDDFANYDDATEGDSAPVIRSVGSGPEEGINWLLPTQRLLAGTDVSEISIRASSFDEPITPTNFVPRDASTRGCADIQAVKVDSAAIFVQKGGERIYLMRFESQEGDYTSFDLTELNPEICRSGVTSIAVQRNPDTMIWFVLTTGEMRTLTFEPSEQVLAWGRVVTPGHVDQVIVVPGSPEDQVIILVDRPQTGGPDPIIQCIERMASTQTALGGNINRTVDSHVLQTSMTDTNVVTGLTHLNNQQVVVWVDGAAVLDTSAGNTDPYIRQLFTVSGGQITLPTASAGQNIVAGLSYTGRWQSVKLAYGAARGTALLQRKRVSHLGLYLTDTAIGGMRIGSDFSNLQGLRLDYRGRFLSRSEVLSEYDYDASQFNGDWDTDSRLAIETVSPFPATVGALAFSLNTKDING